MDLFSWPMAVDNVKLRELNDKHPAALFTSIWMQVEWTCIVLLFVELAIIAAYRGWTAINLPFERDKLNKCTGL